VQKSPGENRPAKLDNFFQNLLRGLQHDDFFTAYEGKDGVRSLLDEFDEIGIDHQGVIVEARELDHSESNLGRAEKACKQRYASLVLLAGQGPQPVCLLARFPRQIGAYSLAQGVQISPDGRWDCSGDELRRNGVVIMRAAKRRYVLLDRDGVINQRMSGGYVTSWNQFQFLPRVLEGLRLLADNGYTALVLSNQGCVGEGLLSSKDLDVITHRFMLEVALSGGNIAQVYYCRHSPQDESGCRKPWPGLFRRAHLEHRFAPETTYFVGDCVEDWRAADDAGCPMILIRRTSFLEVRCVHEESPIVACNLYEAAELILAAQFTRPQVSTMAMQPVLS
jgi:D-glycero-D-manno-heptose 1,7-bisphosphate phosphatase